MIAEIMGKNTNYSEDELTGNFFGTMRYIPFSRGLKKILLEGMQGNNEVAKQQMMEIKDGEIEYVFWKKSSDNLVELDYYIEADNVSIGVEVKFESGLSGENQLEKEANMLLAEGKEKKILLLIAKQKDAKEIYQSNYQKKVFGQVMLVYMTWEDIFLLLDSVETITEEEQVLVEDIRELLAHKGLISFQGYKSISEGRLLEESTEKMIHNAYKVVFECLKRTETLVEKCKYDYDRERYHLPVRKVLMNNNKRKIWAEWTNWIKWSFVMVYQRKVDGKIMKNEWINGPVYFVEFSFDSDIYDNPTITVAKAIFNGMAKWNKGIVDSEYDDIWNMLYDEENFEHIKRDDVIEVKLLGEENLNEPWGFQKLYMKKENLMLLDNNTYQEMIFGTIEELATID